MRGEEKCYTFYIELTPCRGDFVGRNGVRMDPDNFQIIQEWPVPTMEKHGEFIWYNCVRLLVILQICTI